MRDLTPTDATAGEALLPALGSRDSKRTQSDRSDPEPLLDKARLLEASAESSDAHRTLFIGKLKASAELIRRLVRA